MGNHTIKTLRYKNQIKMKEPDKWVIQIDKQHKRDVIFFCDENKMSISDFFNTFLPALRKVNIFKEMQTQILESKIRDMDEHIQNEEKERRKMMTELQRLKNNV